MSNVHPLSDKELISKAIKAQALIDDPTLSEAFEQVRIALLERFESCPIRDREGQHEIKLMLKLLSDVRLNLVSVINSGKVIEYRVSMLERAKRYVNG
jgi:hypothetical protein